MYRPSPSASSAPSYGDSFMPHTAGFAAALPTVPTQIPRAGGYLDGNVGVFPPFAAAAASSPPSSYSSSVPSSYYNIHRSISSHSLPLHLQLPDALTGNALFSSSSPSLHQLAPLLPLSSSPSSSSGDLFELTSCPVRRVFSTGDLQGMNGLSPPRPAPSSESCGQEGGGPFSQKVGRYSAEERKERIERYRVKRHQRNFNKKITYACRKTLADSRPRVKGRFARNGEAETDGDEREASDNGYEYCSYSDTTHKNSTNGAVFGGGGGGDNGEWWWRVPGAAAAADGRQLGFDDDDELWATLGDMVSVNLAS